MFPIGKNLSSGTKRGIAEIFKYKNKSEQIYNSYQIVDNFDLRFGGSNNRCTLYPFCEICFKIKTNKSEILHKFIPRFFFCNKPCWNLCIEKYCCKKELH